MKGLFGIFNPRELQDTKNRIASRNERDLNDYASKPLPESFDVVIYSDSAETGQTATSITGSSNPRHPSNFKWYRVKSLAGHNDMLPEPSDSSGADREANIQVFFQGYYYPLNETNHPKEGDVWSAILEGGNLVRLDKYIRDGEITRRSSNSGSSKKVDNSKDKKTVGQRLKRNLSTEELQLNLDAAAKASELNNGKKKFIIISRPKTDAQMPRDTWDAQDIVPTDKALMNLIKSGEGKYNAANNTRGLKPVEWIYSFGHTAYIADGKISQNKQDYPEQKLVSELTFKELEALQGPYVDDKNRNVDLRSIAAAGAYQCMPATIKGGYYQLAGLTENDLFSPLNQDKVALILLYNKQKKLGEYLLGKNVSLDVAQDGLSGEWASIVSSTRKGTHDGDGANTAATTGKHSYDNVRRLLREAREYNVANNRTSLETIYTYVRGIKK